MNDLGNLGYYWMVGEGRTHLVNVSPSDDDMMARTAYKAYHVGSEYGNFRRFDSNLEHINGLYILEKLTTLEEVLHAPTEE